MPDKIRKTIFFIREYLFPFGCSVCGTDLIDTEEAWYGLCGECRAGIERDMAESLTCEACDVCGKPLISEHDRCLSCRKEGDYSFDRVKVLFPYKGKYRRLLSAYKFGKNIALGNFFTAKIANIVKTEFTPVMTQAAAIVPVPPRPGKIRKTGWDQVEYLARLLERVNSGCLPVRRCIKRLASKSQKELDKENRRINLRGRIVSVRQSPETAVLIDDVMTTGATLEACAAALKEGGAEKVYGICLFYD